jgi:hypothetical protein
LICAGRRANELNLREKNKSQPRGKNDKRHTPHGIRNTQYENCETDHRQHRKNRQPTKNDRRKISRCWTAPKRLPEPRERNLKQLGERQFAGAWKERGHTHQPIRQWIAVQDVIARKPPTADERDHREHRHIPSDGNARVARTPRDDDEHEHRKGNQSRARSSWSEFPAR